MLQYDGFLGTAWRPQTFLTPHSFVHTDALGNSRAWTTYRASVAQPPGDETWG